MVLTIAITFGVLGLFPLLLSLRRISLPLAVHLTLFWLLMFAYEIGSQIINEASYNPGIFLLVNMLLLLYMALLAWLGRINYSPARDPIIAAVQQFHPHQIFLFLIPWILFRIHLIAKYGIFGGLLPSHRQLIGATYLELAIDVLFTYAALGGFFAYAVKLGYDFRRSFKCSVSFVWVSWFLLYLVTGPPQGGRRFTLTAILAVLLPVIYRSDFRIRIRTVIVMGLGVVAAIVSTEFYQMIRPVQGYVKQFQTEGTLGTPAVSSILLALATPQQEGYSPLVENLKERPTLVSFLYMMTSRQLEDLKLAHGSLMRQALYNAVPAILLASKEAVNSDEILARLFDIDPIDYPAGILAEFQAEFFIAAYLLTPLLYLGVLVLYGKVLPRHYSRSDLFRVCVIGASFLTAMYVEDLLPTVLVNIRDLLVIWTLGAAIAFSTRMTKAVFHPTWLSGRNLGR